MPKQDFTDYEKRVSADHERQCRTVLTLHAVWRFCWHRKCRRDRACTGVMLVSAHQDRKVRMQQEIGLSGKACAQLPRCVATADADFYAEFAASLDDLQKGMIAYPQQDLPKFDRCLKDR